MNALLATIEGKVDRGEVDPDDLMECAEAVMELREEYPEAWAICTMADDETLEAVMDDE